MTNYERLHLFNPKDFVGFVGDESSILKSFDGKRRSQITVFMRYIKYRLLSTAAAAPNDFIELGTTSEALGYLGYIDMLNRFFTNDAKNSSVVRRNGKAPEWRFKGHAELRFWRWVCSWSRAVRQPSDIGYSNDRFILPRLIERESVVDLDQFDNGLLFNMSAVGWQEQREERRRSVRQRCERVAELTVGTGQPAIVWCHLNAEGDLLEKIVPDAVQVTGTESDDSKEGKLLDFANGNSRVLVTKTKIAGWGLNFQHSNHMTYFPSHSYESYYQGVRRCWRFGQHREVTVDIVTTEGERGVLANMRGKSIKADNMFANLVSEMNHAEHVDRLTSYDNKELIPTWL